MLLMTCDQRQAQELNYGSEACLPWTTKLLSKLAFKAQGEYRSPLDYILVTVCPKYQKKCLRFYKGKGKPLAKLHNERVLHQLDLFIYKSLINLIKEKSNVESIF